MIRASCPVSALWRGLGGRHGEDAPVDQLVAGIGAVVPVEELGEAIFRSAGWVAMAHLHPISPRDNPLSRAPCVSRALCAAGEVA